MDIRGTCLNCFKPKGEEFEVCPHCGYIAGTLPAQAYNLHPGVILNERYIVGTVIGIGGFGTIYKVFDTMLNTVVAIKEFYPMGLVNRIPGTAELIIYSGDNSLHFFSQLKRFLEEAKNIASFTGDACIVDVFDYFEANNTAYYVMEHLEGETLKEYLEKKGGKLEPDVALAIIKPIVEALARVHAKGIVHRDISPDNIVITADDKIKLIDFGAAKFPNIESDELIDKVVKIGYAPPEQYDSNAEQGPYTDVYALGATLYRVITGVTPVESLARREMDTLQKPSELGVKIDERIERAIMKTMAFAPGSRIPDMRELYEVLYNNKPVEVVDDVDPKKRRLTHIIMAASVGAIFLTVITVLLVYINVVLPQSTITISSVDPDRLTLWVKQSDPQLYGESAEVSVTRATSDFMAENTDYALNIRVIPAADYLDRLRTAFSGGDAPDLFINDYEDPQVNANAMRLDDLLGYLDRGDYLFLQDYERLYPDALKMPIGFHTTVVYANTTTAAASGLTVPDVFDSPDRITLSDVGLSDAVPPDGLIAYTAVDTGKLAPLGALFGGDMRADTGGVAISGATADAVRNMGSLLFDADGNVIDDPLAAIGQDQLVYMVGDTARLPQIQERLPGRYKVSQLTDNSRIMCRLTGEFSINKNTSENRREFATLFLYYLLDANVQNVLNIQNYYAIPLNREAFGDFMDIHTDLSYLVGRESRFTAFGQYEPLVREFDAVARAGLIEAGADPDGPADGFLNAYVR